MIIQFYADSLGLPRPGIVKVEETYIQVFANWLRMQSNEPVYLYDRAKGAAIINELYNVFKQDLTYIDGKKDILIIHEGVCDCAPRPVSPMARKIIARLPTALQKKAVDYIHNNRAKLFKKGYVYYHTPKAAYKTMLEDWLKTAVTEFEKIILFTIAPTNEATEKHSPGFSNSIIAYNQVIKDAVAAINSHKIFLVDTYTIINAGGSNIDKYITAIDGHHLTQYGHSLYAQKLEEIFKTNV